MKKILLEKILQKKIKLGVIGLGYVGLPLAVEFAKNGIEVLGFDLDPRKIEALNQGKNYIKDISDSLVKRLCESGLLKATSDMKSLESVDAISICVPTPLRKTKDPDMSYIVEAADMVAKTLRAGQVVILESTTYPGTTTEVLLPRFEETGLKVGKDFFLAFSPERVDPGNPKWFTRNTPKVIGGSTSDCLEVASKLYEIAIEKMVPVSSPACAEMVKLLENTFRAVNIGLANEIAIMSRKLNIDCWEVIEAAATKPFGYMPFFPGPGLGGHCIPVDPHYLSWKLKTINYDARFIQLADSINTSMPSFVVQIVSDALNNQKKCLNGSRVLLAGMAYKADIDDYRESPSLQIFELLEQKGVKVDYVDPFIPEMRLSRERYLKGISLNEVDWSDFDAVVLLACHSAFKIEEMARKARILVDTRNSTKGIDLPSVVKL